MASGAAPGHVELVDRSTAPATEILEACEKRLSVAQQLIENEIPYIPVDIDLDVLATDDISEQIQAWLKNQEPAVEEPLLQETMIAIEVLPGR